MGVGWLNTEKLDIDKLEDIFGFTPDQVPNEERKENVSM